MQSPHADFGSVPHVCEKVCAALHVFAERLERMRDNRRDSFKQSSSDVWNYVPLELKSKP